uniref:hypothetical protein n=1 Tax=Klebsiella pneumoniae TaxID=573 RepID=UPI00163D8732
KAKIDSSYITKQKITKEVVADSEQKPDQVTMDAEKQTAETAESKLKKAKIDKGSVEAVESAAKITDHDESMKAKIDSSYITKQKITKEVADSEQKPDQVTMDVE